METRAQAKSLRSPSATTNTSNAAPDPGYSVHVLSVRTFYDEARKYRDPKAKRSLNEAIEGAKDNIPSNTTPTSPDSDSTENSFSFDY